MYQEDILFLAVMGAGIVGSLLVPILVGRKSASFRHAFIHSALTSLVFFSIAVLWWFITASDGFSQVIGAACYGAAFLLSLFLQTVLLYVTRKLQKKP